MGEGKTSTGPALAMVAGGVALALLMFITWWDNAGIELSAWDGLRRTDVLIFAAALIAAAAGAWLGFGDVGPERRWVAVIGAGAASLAALIVVIRIASPPGEADPKIGIFLALVAAVVAAIGGVMTLRS